MYPDLSKIKLLITDLDNTLYDWVSYYSSSFYSMLEELSLLLGVNANILIEEFKEIHKYYENTEQPFALVEIPSVKSRYSGVPLEELIRLLDGPLHAFNKKRVETLKLYEGVEETLEELNNRGIVVIGHTESSIHNSLFRLKKLGIIKYLKHLYALEAKSIYSPYKGQLEDYYGVENSFIRVLPKEERKPNPRLIADICKQEGFDKSQVAYIGDSLTKDISMAKEAGILSIWAKYGKSYNIDSWENIVKITHWTDDDVEKETFLRNKYQNVEADFSINSFNELIKVLDLR